MKLFSFLILFFFAGNMLISQELHFLDKDLPCMNKNFNVHVHVVLDSLGNTNITNEALNNAFETANQYFSPICWSFEICEVDTIPNYSFDLMNKEEELGALRAIYGHENRLNLYLIQSFGSPICGIGGGNSVVMAKPCTGITLTHELGHVFSLLHTFEGNGSENVDGSNCDTEGDLVCDTPADPFDPGDLLTVWERDCEFVYLGLDANSQFYQPDLGNIMSYYGCRCGFTRGQYLKMIDHYQNLNTKFW